MRDDDPPTTLHDADSGDPVTPGLVDLNTGTPLTEMRVRARGKVVEGIARSRETASL